MCEIIDIVDEEIHSDCKSRFEDIRKDVEEASRIISTVEDAEHLDYITASILQQQITDAHWNINHIKNYLKELKSGRQV